MKVWEEVSKEAIVIAASILTDHSIFHRIVEEIKRNNEAMPHATGAEKRAVVLKDLEIIFDGLVEPICYRLLSILIDMAVGFIEAELKQLAEDNK